MLFLEGNILSYTFYSVLQIAIFIWPGMASGLSRAASAGPFIYGGKYNVDVVFIDRFADIWDCLLYTSDAADE